MVSMVKEELLRQSPSTRNPTHPNWNGLKHLRDYHEVGDGVVVGDDVSVDA